MVRMGPEEAQVVVRLVAGMGSLEAFQGAYNRPRPRAHEVREQRLN
jgi:hypothetical protein